MPDKYFRKIGGSPAFLYFFFLIICLIPLFWISAYNNPSSCDYSWSSEALHLGFFGTLKSYYFDSGGRYFSTMLLCLNPLIFHSYIGYKLLAPILLTLLVLSVYLLIKIFIIDADFNSKMGLAFLLVFVYLINMPDISQGVFWMSGSFTYLVPDIMALLLCCTILLLLKSGKKYFLICAILLSAAIIGSNEIAMVYTDLIILLIAAGNFYSNKKLNISLLVLLVFSILFSAIVLMAPGNANRLASFPLSQKFSFSLASAISSNIIYGEKWLLSFFPVSILLLDGITSNATSKGIVSHLFRVNPWTILAGWLTAPFIAFFIGFWSEGGILPGRTINTIYFYFIIGGLYFLLSLRNYLDEKYKIKNNMMPIGIKFLILYAICFSNNNCTMAYANINEAKAYNQEILSRQTILLDPSEPRCSLYPIKKIPQTLYLDDITKDSSDWRNVAVCGFYNKKKIVIK